MNQDEFENGDYGRNPRFLPGWFIVPLIVFIPVGWFYLIRWLISWI